jgi:hypothetical protein
MNETATIRSDENVIKTDLIHTALSLAELELRRKGVFDTGPHSPVGLLVRARDARAREIRAALDLRRRGL